MSARAIRFWHRHRICEVDDQPNTRTVLDWLREDQRLTGTKEGCAEGDCGACTVVVGELGDCGSLRLQPVNACIRFLHALDGKALFTVEDLAGADGTLHAVQQALVDHHGSQCGFCTPGFTMSLWAGWERHRAAGTVPTRQQLADDLAGNLCRCTGYRPILDAGQRAYDAPPVRLDAAPVIAALRTLRDDPPLQRAGWHAPRTLADLAAARTADPEARLLAGGTDVGLWVTKQLKPLPRLISLTEVAELQQVERDEAVLRIGAAVSLQQGWAALVDDWPALAEMALRFASPPIRHAGTLVGNLANGSPIGDAAPVLMALDATLLLRRGEALRRVPLADFYTGYQRNRLEPGEFVQAVEVPRADAAWTVVAYKISKRFDSDISALSLGAALRLEEGRVADLRLAWGGLAATVRRSAAAEAALRGRAWDEAALVAAQVALAQDFSPLSDLRASRDYRLQVAANLLRRLWLATRAVDPLPTAALSVWAREEAA